ncbi:MAG: hypothetical protein IH597_00225 [Bacteroidales bacterium]|nr:hypothetical protein [Bacteroidales bacterium]
MHLQKSTTVFILLAVAFFLFGGNHRLFAQASNFPTGARSAGMAGASVASSDVWATFNNPAMLAQINEIQAGLNYENRFMVRELGISSLSAILPVNAGAFGLAFNQFGSNLYSQSFLGVSYGRKFTDRFQAGVRLDARHTRLAEDYGRRTNVSFAIGFAANLTDDLVLGAALFNPVRIKSAGDFDEYLPAIYRAGLAYRIENNFTITVETEKDVRYKPSFRAGIEYRFKEIASVRAGIGANPLNHAFGFGFHFRNFVFDIAALRHEVLGYSPQASIIWIAK